VAQKLTTTISPRRSPRVIVRSLRGEAPSEVVAAITTEVEQFAATGLADDLCVLAARIHAG
jgi:hypothetical protein